MTNKLELKSSHEVIYTVGVEDVESIFYCKPTDPDILTVLMKDGKRLYCDEVCPVSSLQKEPKKCMYTNEHYTDEDRKVLCEDCEERCEYSKKEEPVSKQKLSNVQRIGKNWKEPVSDDLEKAAWLYYDKNRLPIPPEWDLHKEFIDFFKAGAEWQKTKDSTCVSKDLDKAAKEWLTPQLDKSYANYGERKMMELTRFDGYAMLEAIEFGMKKMKEQMIKNAIEREVKLDSGGYPYVDCHIEMYDYLDFKPLAKAGDKVKLIVIKED